jgi:hypothetical protein
LIQDGTTSRSTLLEGIYAKESAFAVIKVAQIKADTAFLGSSYFEQTPFVGQQTQAALKHTASDRVKNKRQAFSTSDIHNRFSYLSLAGIHNFVSAEVCNPFPIRFLAYCSYHKGSFPACNLDGCLTNRAIRTHHGHDILFGQRPCFSESYPGSDKADS